MKIIDYIQDKTTLYILFIILCMICFTGCGKQTVASKDEVQGEQYTAKKVSLGSTEYASDKDVDRFVKKHVIGEEVEFKEKHSGDREGYDYVYASKDRDLTFLVKSTLQGYGGMPNGNPTKQIQTVQVKYADGIRDYYWDDIENVLANSDLKVEGKKESARIDIYYETYSDLEHVAKVLSEIDDLYKKEETYNSKAFLKKYPLCRFHIDYKSADMEKHYCTVMIDITGEWSEDSLYKKLVSEHCRVSANGDIYDPTIPEDAAMAAHKDALYYIYIRDKNISDEAYHKRFTYNNAKRRLGPAEDSFYAAQFYEPWDTYLIHLDVGPVYAGNTWETITEVYLDELADGYTFSRDEKTGEVTFTCGGVEWKIVTRLCDKVDKNRHEYSNSYCFEATFYKNGAEQDIPYIRECDEGTGRMKNECIGISAQDFADIFGVTADINESEDYIRFE